jgi:hypothetical protein
VAKLPTGLWAAEVAAHITKETDTGPSSGTQRGKDRLELAADADHPRGRSGVLAHHLCCETLAVISPFLSFPGFLGSSLGPAAEAGKPGASLSSDAQIYTCTGFLAIVKTFLALEGYGRNGNFPTLLTFLWFLFSESQVMLLKVLGRMGGFPIFLMII